MSPSMSGGASWKPRYRPRRVGCGRSALNDQEEKEAEPEDAGVERRTQAAPPVPRPGQMARALGMNPRKLGNKDNHDQEPWKMPLRHYIEHLYYKRFGKDRPAAGPSVEVEKRRRHASPRHSCDAAGPGEPQGYEF